MHDTVAKLRKHIQEDGVQEGVAALFSQRFQDGGLSKALAEPLSSQLENAYIGAFKWVRLASRLDAPAAGETVASLLRDITFTSRQLRVVLSELTDFLDRAEDNLGDRDEITHRESGYEREIAPFARADSTDAFRAFMADRVGAKPRLAAEAAQIEADLLKIIYMEQRLRKAPPKVADLYAIVMELTLDVRRHLVPAFEEGSVFLKSLDEAAGRL